MASKTSKPTVLAVDDKRANLLALDALLGADYNLILADSGAEALRVVEKSADIDVILMDVQMPGLDGFETVERIKAMEAARDIPIVFVTAVYNEDPYVKRGYAVGGIDYFSKPFDPEVLRLKVGIYAGFRRKAETLKQRERHVRDSEELLKVGRKLSGILESLPVGVLIADMDGRICQATEEASRIWRSVDPDFTDYGEILKWWESSGQRIKARGGALERAIHGGLSSHSEALTLRCVDGSSRMLFISAVPLRGLDGVIAGAVVLLQDISERAKIGQDLEEKVANLVNAGLELEQISP
jgi:CheY-like chemotaxis protein